MTTAPQKDRDVYNPDDGAHALIEFRYHGDKFLPGQSFPANRIPTNDRKMLEGAGHITMGPPSDFMITRIALRQQDDITRAALAAADPGSAPVARMANGTAPPSEDESGTPAITTARVLGQRKDGPTFEDYLKAGYKPESYPPDEYAEVSSPGLTEYRKSGALPVKKK